MQTMKRLGAWLGVCLMVGCSSPANPGVSAQDGDGGTNTTSDGGNNQASSGSSGGSSGQTSGSASSSSSGAASSSGGSGGASSSSSSSGASSSGVASSSSSSGGPQCQSSRDCTLGNICVGTVCVAGCMAPSDCPPQRATCDLASGPNGQCVQCVDAMDCTQPNAQCVSGACRAGCGAGGDCPFPLTCETATNSCVRCLGDGECGTLQICQQNECVAGCRADGDCPNGAVCETTQCVPGCRTNPDTCPTGTVCRVAQGQAGQCQAGCNQPDDCGPPGEFQCVNNQCIRQCQGDNECPTGAICQNGGCEEGCRPPTRDCAPGRYCTATGSGQAGACLPGCEENGDCVGITNVCRSADHTCVECLETADCTLGGNVAATCNTTSNTCDITCDASAGFDLCLVLGFRCDANTMTCVECTDMGGCDPFESCVDARCVPQANRPLCADCSSDEQCGDTADLCVTRFAANRQERVCGTDCSNGGTCPAGTECTQVGGGMTPLRGHQCLPVNSAMASASCAARNDLMGSTECNRGSQCGLNGGGFSSDAICSGAGGSQGHCSVFCTLGGTDCPTGFFCEDPPDSPQQEYPPRCSPAPQP